MIQNSYLLFKGPSLWNGEEIAVVITGLTSPSTNRKTGVMLQSWIFPTADKPTTLVKNGDDAASCGECPLRGKGCYVNMVSVNNIFGRLGKLETVDEEVLQYIRNSRIGLRLGAYGDPAMVPFNVWEPLIKAAKFSLGYTHQWHWCDPVWKDYCQASVESEELRKEANALGWHTFRIREAGGVINEGERLCRNEQSKFVNCTNCRLCNGSKNIVVTAHGNAAKLNHFKNVIWQQEIQKQSLTTSV